MNHVGIHPISQKEYIDKKQTKLIVVWSFDKLETL